MATETIISKIYPDGTKCGGCNRGTDRLFALSSFDEEEIDEYGLCGRCLAEELEEEQLKVISKHS